MTLKNLPFPSEELESFDPSTLDELEQVVEEAWQELAQRNVGAGINGLREKLTRELMAHRVMARAMRGDTDPQRLKEHALWDF